MDALHCQLDIEALSCLNCVIAIVHILEHGVDVHERPRPAVFGDEIDQRDGLFVEPLEGCGGGFAEGDYFVAKGERDVSIHSSLSSCDSVV